MKINEEEIITKENKLREWFTRGLSEKNRVIDGFDIGWGGTARWASSILAQYLDINTESLLLDVACGYGTFIVELGWRFPQINLFGFNLDFNPPHDVIFSLLSQGEVEAQVIVGDVCYLPFKKDYLECVTCFIGLQDIMITRGKECLGEVVSSLLQLVLPQNYLLLIDNFTEESFKEIFANITVNYKISHSDSFTPDCRWSRDIGLKVIELYSQGYLQQQRDSKNPPKDFDKSLATIRTAMIHDLENQLTNTGYYNPWGTMRLYLLERKNESK
jgi:SAM-dependent methyltransferase